MNKAVVPMEQIRHKRDNTRVDDWPELRYVKRYVQGKPDAADKWVSWRIRMYKHDPERGRIVAKAVRRYGLRRGVKKYIDSKLKTVQSIMSSGYQENRGEVTGRFQADGSIVPCNGHHRVMTLRALGYTHIPRMTICD